MFLTSQNKTKELNLTNLTAVLLATLTLKLTASNDSFLINVRSSF